jgi:hypothetical protein
MSLRLSLLTAACVAGLGVFGGGSAVAAGGSSQIPLAGTGAPQTGDFTPSGETDVTQA